MSWIRLSKTSTVRIVAVGALLQITGLIVSSAWAEDYDYEVGLSYGNGSSDTTTITTVGGVPTPAMGINTGSSDSDSFDLSGTWYYAALSDDNGPRSRAAFLSRASSVSVGYSRSDESGSFVFTGGSLLPSATGSNDTTIDGLSLGLRHVWRDSGWYAQAGVVRSEFSGRSVLNSISTTADFDATLYTLGIGKYLGNATTVDLSVAEADSGGSSLTTYALTFSHIGALNANWDYGADFAYTKSDQSGDDGYYSLLGSLYPSSDVAFGVGFSRRQLAGGRDLDDVQGFASWFVREHIELTMRYRQDISSHPAGQDLDSNQFTVGASVRF